jgi:SAM-dependent methyltransferase
MNTKMFNRIKVALGNTPVYDAFYRDVQSILLSIGMDPTFTGSFFDNVLQRVLDSSSRRITSLDELETEVHRWFSTSLYNGTPLLDIITERVTGRAETIFGQIYPYLNDRSGNIIDFGCGDGQVTDLLHDQGLNIVGYDVVQYHTKPRAAIHLFDGIRIPCDDLFFDTAIVTNVIHHEENNERVLEELTRIVTTRLVIIETVPVGNSAVEIKLDHERTFLNDWLYNRGFHPGTDIPVPGTYETPQGWIERFKKHGWNMVESINLGIDIDLIPDTHHQFVFER